LDVANVFRNDLMRPSLDREVVLANAPQRDGECYLVPAVFGES
jgi:aspartyl-tRNA(Asn)/glutamyl-tRNA(Gln) amidotransferase subunit C